MRSDMQSESRQLTLRLSPVAFNASFNWSVSYVYSNVRDRVRGFSSTVGNPFDAFWGRSSADSRHQIVYNLGYNLWDAVRVNWYGQFRSGSPFTPTIAGDVNGDGYANDRAFVFDPAQTADPALAAGMRELLNCSTTVRARREDACGSRLANLPRATAVRAHGHPMRTCRSPSIH
jgi:hypothetical protein